MATMKCQRFLLLVLVLFAPRAVTADVAELVRKAEETKDPRTKLGYLNQALREDDSHWVLWALRADAHRMLEQYDKAESDATEAIGKGRGEKDAWRVRALVRLARNDSDGTIRDAGEALRLGDKTVMVHVIRGEAYLSKGDLQAAVRDADSAIAIDERASSAYRLRALAYERLGNESGALADLNKAVRVDNQNVDALIQRIAFHIRTKRFKYALSDCEYGEQIAPGSEAVKSLRIEALRKSGQVDEAVRVARAETASQPRSNLLLHQLALACYDAKNWKDVIAAANDLVAIAPDHLGGLLLLGEAHRMQGDYQQAVSCLTRAAAIDPKDVFTLFGLAMAHRGLGSDTSALDSLNKALAIDPEDLSCLRQKVLVLISLQRYDEALEACERAERSHPEEKDLALTRAEVLARMGRREEAADSAQRAAEGTPNDPEGWLRLVRFHYEHNSWEEVIKAADRLLALQSDNAEAFWRRATAHRITGAVDKCVEDCTKALQANPGCGEAYAERGRAKFLLWQDKDAERDLDEALKLQPDNTFVLTTSVLLDLRTKRWEQAIVRGEQLVRLGATDRERASAKVLIGRAHYRRGDHQEAVRICTEAIALDGSYAEAYFERANSLRMLGQYAASIEDCEKGLSTEADSAYGLVIRGLCRAELGNRQEALEDYQRAVQLGETSHLVVWALAFLGDLARQDGDHAFAVDYATRAIDVKYDRGMESEYCDAMSQAYVVRAASRRALGQCDQAVEDCTRALSHVPTNALALVERGASHRALGDYERAVNDCGEAVQLQPRLWLGYHERAYALLAKHRGDGMQLAGNVVELPAILRDPIGAADVSFEIGRTARGPHSLTPAGQEQSEPRDGVGELGPSASPRPYLLEPVLRDDDQGREVHPLDQAISDFQMLLQADFDTASTACGLAQCLHELGKLSDAEDVCNRELSRDDTNAQLHVARAMILYSSGKHLDGLDAAKKAVAVNATMPEAKLAEAYGLALTNAWPEARQACEQLLQLDMPDIIAARGLLLWYACWTMEMDGRGTVDSAAQALADMLAKTGARTDRWPGPIVSALVDGQDLADLASRIPPTVEEHVRQRQLCQVLFYLGIRDLGAGEVILAKKRLQGAVEVGNPRHMEYLLSDTQLRRLGAW